MPTENRSSNTEQMVSVPREWLNRVALLQMPLDELQEQAVELLCEPCDEPAAQHQGEPVFMVRSHGSCCWEESNGEGLDITLSMPDEYEVRKLYLHPPASDGFSAGDMADQGAKAFRDGQRALALPERRQWNGLGNAADNLKASGWNACLDEVRRLNEASISPE